MVGVGGRSRGCLTCRTRRVKCDQRKPTCARCEKANYTCSGYNRQFQFIDEAPKLQRRRNTGSSAVAATAGLEKPFDDALPATTQLLLLPPSPRSKPVRAMVISDDGGSSSVPAAEAGDESSKSISSALATLRAPIGVNLDLDLIAFEDNIYVSYLLTNLFTGADYLKGWMHQCVSDINSPTAQSSMRALGTMYFSKLHRDPRSKAKALVLYGEALQNLNRDLQDQKRAWGVSVLTSAMALQFFELIAFNSQAGWLHHAGGLGRLIQLRGPEHYRTPEERQVLQTGRLTVAMESFVKRKHCFLEQPVWKHLPWSLDPQGKTPLLQLHDLLCDLPGLFEDTLLLSSAVVPPSQKELYRKELAGKITDRLQILFEWRAAWEAQNPACCFEVDAATTHQLPSDRAAGGPSALPWPTVLHYTALRTANELCFYNALILSLFRRGNEVIGPGLFDFAALAARVPFAATTNPILAHPSSIQTPQDIAAEICRSLDYHMLERQMSAGSYLALFPLRLAYQAYPQDSMEAAWLRRRMNQIADSTGFEISRQLGGSDDMRRDMNLAFAGGGRYAMV